jgi:tetratricopeptide (TPR) repeat protein
MLQAWLAARRVLFLLDNVDDPRLVHRLLPGGPGCRYLVAGAPPLAKLPGARMHDLPELATDDAIELLATFGGPALVNEDRAAAADLAERFGRQPEAIRLLGQLIRDRRWPPGRISQAVARSVDLATDSRQLAESVALRPLWEVCCLTYRDLSAAHRKILRALALVEISKVGATAIAAVARMPADRASRLLADLTRQGFVEPEWPGGHYRLRRPLVTTARYYIVRESTARELDRAQLRLVRYHAARAHEHAEPLLPSPRRPGQEQERARVMADARSWFDKEHELLFWLVTSAQLQAAGDRSAAAHSALVRLAMSLCTWYSVEVRLDDWRRVCAAVLTMPRARAKPATAAWAHNQLGVVRRLSGEPAAAAAELDAADRLSRGARNRGRAQVQTNLGLALIDQRELDSAMRCLENGLALRSRANRHGQAISALALGVAHLRVEELDASRRYLSHAANTFDALYDHRGLAATLNALGVLLWGQDDRLGAEEHWELARRLYVEEGDELGLACVLLNIGASLVLARPDRAAEAHDLLAESLRLRAGQPASRGAGLTHLYLGDAAARCKEPGQACRHWAEAARILTPLGGPEAAEAAQRLSGTGGPAS